jgi:hypothetical protein
MGMSERSQRVAIPPGLHYLTQYVDKIQEQHPFVDRNVFIMTPYSTPASVAIFSAITRELEDHGLVPLKADQKAFALYLWWNVASYMLACSYGIVVYEPHLEVPFNPNVSIEAGFMLALDRPVLFLVNKRLTALPVDFAGHLHRTFNAYSVTAVTTVPSNFVMVSFSSLFVALPVMRVANFDWGAPPIS